HLWLQASTATIDAHRFDEASDERSGILGGHESGAPDSWRFSIDVARAWERAFDDAIAGHTRKIASVETTSMACSTSPRRIRCPMPSSCKPSGIPTAVHPAFPQGNGCWRLAPS